MIGTGNIKKRLAMFHIIVATTMVACNSGSGSSSPLDEQSDTAGVAAALIAPSAAARTPNVSTVNASTVSSSTDEHWLSDIQSCIDHLTKNKYVFGGNDLDCTAGIAATDCSGFVNDIAQAYFPKAYHSLVVLAKGRPTVGVYYRLIAESKTGSSLIPVASMNDLVPGDIIMWIYQGAEREKIGASGHMMLVLGAAELVGNNQYRVLIADSAESGHDQDTRTQGQSGLGMGYIYFRTDSKAFPIGYAWNNPRNYLTSSPIQLGHFVD
jgi:hypothetical protein